MDKNLQLPLFGHFCCRLAVQPDCLQKDYICGILKFVEYEPDLFWCVLSKFKLHLWRMKTELKDEPAYLKHTSNKRAPDLIIPINSHTKINQNKHLIILINSDKSHAFECINDQHKDWYRCLNNCIEDFRAWEPIAEYNMELVPVSRSQYLFQDRPAGSLYNDTPIQGNFR